MSDELQQFDPDADEHMEVTVEPFRIPAGSMPTSTVQILGFIAPDGSFGYAVKQGGSAYLTEYLGLLDIARSEFLRG